MIAIQTKLSALSSDLKAIGSNNINKLNIDQKVLFYIHYANKTIMKLSTILLVITHCIHSSTNSKILWINK